MRSWMMKERKVVMMMFYALRVLLPAMRAKKTMVSMYAAKMTAMKLLQAALIPASLLPILIPMRTHL